MATLVWKMPIQQQVPYSFPREGALTRESDIRYGGYFICCFAVDTNAPIPDPDMRLVGRWRHVGSSRHIGIGHRVLVNQALGLRCGSPGSFSPPGPVHKHRYMLLFLVERLEDGYKYIC